MSLYVSRPFRGVTDIPSLLDFARTTTAARPPGLTYWHAGDMTWQFWNMGACDDVHLWEDDDGLLGLALFEAPTVAQLDVRREVPVGDTLFAEMLAWAEHRRAESYRPGEPIPLAYAMFGDEALAVNVFDHQSDRIAVLRAHGYAHADRFGYHFTRSLATPIPGPELPPGANLRHVTDADLEERIDLHRDAWSVWGESTATIEAYRQIRTAPNYGETLDIVLEDEDGRFLSYCICWADDANGVGLFEPVGTRPSHTRRGFGKQVLYEGFRRLRDRGLHTAIVGTASVNEPAAALYTSAGFELVGLDHFWVKRL